MAKVVENVLHPKASEPVTDSVNFQITHVNIYKCFQTFSIDDVIC